MSERNPGMRIASIGLSNRVGTDKNLNDAYIKTFEFPVVAVASAAEQDTGVEGPTESMQVIAAYLTVEDPEVTALTKTVDVGFGATSAGVLSATDVSAAGAVGSPVTAAINSTASNTFKYTLALATFAELKATCTVVALCVDSK